MMRRTIIRWRVLRMITSVQGPNLEVLFLEILFRGRLKLRVAEVLGPILHVKLFT